MKTLSIQIERVVGVNIRHVRDHEKYWALKKHAYEGFPVNTNGLGHYSVRSPCSRYPQPSNFQRQCAVKASLAGEHEGYSRLW